MTDGMCVFGMVAAFVCGALCRRSGDAATAQPLNVEQQKAAEATTEEQHHEAIREALN